jgi:hypothetical protein
VALGNNGRLEEFSPIAGISRMQKEGKIKRLVPFINSLSVSNLASDVVTASFQRVDNQMTSFTHLVVDRCV